MARKQLTGGWKIIDNWFFHGAEQETIAREQEDEKQQFIHEYAGEFEVSVLPNNLGFTGSCERCGNSIAGTYSTLPGNIIICTSCTDKKVEQRGYDTNYLPWNQWKLPGGKRPVKLG